MAFTLKKKNFFGHINSDLLFVPLPIQVTHKNRQKRMAKLMADLAKEPEPYIEPQSQDQYEEFPISGAAAVQVKPEFGKDISGDKVIPTPGTLYAELGGVEPVNLLSFAYQIASGMVKIK